MARWLRSRSTNPTGADTRKSSGGSGSSSGSSSSSSTLYYYNPQTKTYSTQKIAGQTGVSKAAAQAASTTSKSSSSGSSSGLTPTQLRRASSFTAAEQIRRYGKVVSGSSTTQAASKATSSTPDTRMSVADFKLSPTGTTTEYDTVQKSSYGGNLRAGLVPSAFAKPTQSKQAQSYAISQAKNTFATGDVSPYGGKSVTVTKEQTPKVDMITARQLMSRESVEKTLLQNAKTYRETQKRRPDKLSIEKPITTNVKDLFSTTKNILDTATKFEKTTGRDLGVSKNALSFITKTQEKTRNIINESGKYVPKSIKDSPQLKSLSELTPKTLFKTTDTAVTFYLYGTGAKFAVNTGKNVISKLGRGAITSVVLGEATGQKGKFYEKILGNKNLFKSEAENKEFENVLELASKNALSKEKGIVKKFVGGLLPGTLTDTDTYYDTVYDYYSNKEMSMDIKPILNEARVRLESRDLATAQRTIEGEISGNILGGSSKFVGGFIESDVAFKGVLDRYNTIDIDVPLTDTDLKLSKSWKPFQRKTTEGTKGYSSLEDPRVPTKEINISRVDFNKIKDTISVDPKEGKNIQYNILEQAEIQVGDKLYKQNQTESILYGFKKEGTASKNYIEVGQSISRPVVDTLGGISSVAFDLFSEKVVKKVFPNMLGEVISTGLGYGLDSPEGSGDFSTIISSSPGRTRTFNVNTILNLAPSGKSAKVISVSQGKGITSVRGTSFDVTSTKTNLKDQGISYASVRGGDGKQAKIDTNINLIKDTNTKVKTFLPSVPSKTKSNTSSTKSFTNTFTNTNTNSITRVDTFVENITDTKTDVPTKTNPFTENFSDAFSNAFTTTSTNTFVTTPKIIIPPVLPGGGGGSAKFFFGGKRRGRTTRYLPSVLGIQKKAKRKKKGFLTGLEIRGI